MLRSPQTRPAAPQKVCQQLARQGANAIAEFRQRCPDAPFDLRGADLTGIDLSGADLRGANLAGATLDGGSLAEAWLQGAVLRDASLRGVDLRGVRGLLPAQLAGADLTGALLPDGVSAERLAESARLGDAADIARTIFMWMIGGCAFIWLMLASTTQLQLLANDGVVNLPVFDVDAPSELFFLAGPFLLIGIYYYLHVYLQRLWDVLATLPAIFPDGESIDRKTHGWMVLGLVRWRCKRLSGHPPMFLVQTCLCLLLTWGLVPITVYAVWQRCAIRHDWNHSILQVVACALVVQVALGSLLAAGSAFGVRRRLGLQVGHIAVAVAVLYSMHGVMQSTFRGESEFSWLNAKVDHYHPTDRTPKWGRSKRELQNRYLEVSPFYSVHDGQRDPDFTPDVAKSLNDLLKGWREAYAEFSGPLLANAHLEGAEVNESDFSSADLVGSQWSRATLLNADFTQANLSGADFSHATMPDTVLLGASAREACLYQAHARGLIALGADFTGAKLLEFSTAGAPADLRLARFNHALMQSAQLPMARLQQASLVKAQLNNADLRHADLSHADLRGANLQGADLRAHRSSTPTSPGPT